MQQYRKSNFSDVFCLNYIFVIDATVKHLISKSFPKCGVFLNAVFFNAVIIKYSAVTMAAHIFFLIESNQILVRWQLTR